MLLQRDILVIALAFGIAASLYVVTFRDLMALSSASPEIGHVPLYVGHL